MRLRSRPRVAGSDHRGSSAASARILGQRAPRRAWRPPRRGARSRRGRCAAHVARRSSPQRILPARRHRSSHWHRVQPVCPPSGRRPVPRPNSGGPRRTAAPAPTRDETEESADQFGADARHQVQSAAWGTRSPNARTRRCRWCAASGALSPPAWPEGPEQVVDPQPGAACGNRNEYFRPADIGPELDLMPSVGTD